MAANKAATKFWNGLKKFTLSMGRLGKSPTSLSLVEGGCRETNHSRSQNKRLYVLA